MSATIATRTAAYKEYADHEVQWLGHLPRHWKARRLGTIAEMRVSNVDKHSKEEELPVRLCNYVDVYKNDRISRDMPFMRATASTEEIGRFRLRKYDVLITKDSETWDDIGVPALVTEPADDLISGYHLALLRPNGDILGPYLFRTLQSRGVAQQFHIGANGVTRYGLTHNAIRSVILPLPPTDEQAAIVRYLDDVDQRIRAYVSAKERLIALLEEERQAVIHQAVTRGLDPNVKLKPSSVEWLGDVPEHWAVWRIKQVSGILRGKFTHRPRNDPSLYDGPYPFIQTGDIAGTNKMLSGYKQTLNDNGFAVSKMFPKGTLVMTIAANIGDVAVLDFDACFPDSVVGFVPGVRVDRDYLYYLFLAMKNELLREAPVNTQGNLNVDRIGSRTIILPQIGEQTDIVNHVEQSVSTIDSAMDHARRQIELMEEYRTRLIADVVTGKIDVTRTQARTGAPGQSPEFQPIKQK